MVVKGTGKPPPPRGGVPPELVPPAGVPPFVTPAAGAEAAGDGLGEEPIGGSVGVGVALTGSDGVGSGEALIGGKLGDGRTGVGRTGVGRTGKLGVGTGSVGRGTGDGKSTARLWAGRAAIRFEVRVAAAEVGKTTAASAAEAPQPARVALSSQLLFLLPPDFPRRIQPRFPLVGAEPNCFKFGPSKSMV
jgi:hypothetical protein